MSLNPASVVHNLDLFEERHSCLNDKALGYCSGVLVVALTFKKKND
jgi:hypothetical protein